MKLSEGAVAVPTADWLATRAAYVDAHTPPYGTPVSETVLDAPMQRVYGVPVGYEITEIDTLRCYTVVGEARGIRGNSVWISAPNSIRTVMATPDAVRPFILSDTEWNVRIMGTLAQAMTAAHAINRYRDNA